MNMMLDGLNEILKELKVDIVLDYPLFMPLLVKMKFREDSKCGIAATDGEIIFIGDEFKNYDTENQKSIIFHELLHVAFLHNSRMKELIEEGYLQTTVNIAGDYIVNNFLLYKMKKKIDVIGTVYKLAGIESYEEETIESICKKLGKQTKNDNGNGEPMTGDGEPDGNNKMGNDIIPSRKNVNQIKQALAEGLILQGNCRGTNSADLVEYIENLLKPEINWIKVLKRYLSSERDRFSRSYNRINKKKSFLYKYKVVMPGDDVVNKKINLIIALDTSGSMSYADLQKSLSEIFSMKFSSMTIIQADMEINNIATNFKDIKNISGRGGTSFIPVMDYIVKNIKKQDNAILIYFTDMEGDQETHSFQKLYNKAKTLLRKDFWVHIEDGKIIGIKNKPEKSN